MSAICDAHKKKVDIEHIYKIYNPGEDRKSGSWSKYAAERTSTQRGWAPRPPVEQPRITGKETLLWP